MVVGTIFLMLIPASNMQQTMKLILNLFLISTIFIPIINVFSSNKFENYLNNYNIKQFNENNLKENQTQISILKLKSALQIVFRKNGYKDLDISIDISEQDKVQDIKITLPKNSTYNIENIKEITKQQTGINPTISYKND